MAQETRVNPIQLDNTASQIMMSMAESIDRSKERDKALAAEKERERMRIEAEGAKENISTEQRTIEFDVRS